MKQIFKSIGLLFIISILLSWVLSKTILIETRFYNIFIVTILGQIIFFYFYNNILKYIANLNIKKKEFELMKLLNDNNIFIECGACKSVNNTPINLSVDNLFECKKCGTVNKIDISYSTIVQTKIYE